MPTSRPSGLIILLLVASLCLPLAAQMVPLDALMRGGRIHYEGQRYERAREQFQKALDQYGATTDNTNLAQIHTWLGLTEEGLRHSVLAADHFITALEKDTNAAARIRANEQWQYLSYTALFNATRDNYSAGQYEAAVKYALSGLKVDPAKSQTYALIASCYSQLGRYDNMRDVATSLLKLDAGSAEAFGLLGLYFLQKPDSLWPTKEVRFGRWDSSVFYYDKAVAIYQGRFVKARTELGQTLKLADPVRLDRVAWDLVTRSRVSQHEMKRYIETDLKATNQLPEVAQFANRLLVAANNTNTASARAGSAMLRASADVRGDTAERFRSRAESLFSRAVQYDSSDFTALFDLGIAQYQGKQDSSAEVTLSLVVKGAVAPVAGLPAPWPDSLVALVSPEAAKTGWLELTGPLAAAVDSVLFANGRTSLGFTWLYFPDLRARPVTGPLAIADTAGMFLSLEQPVLLEQAYLWLGSSQTGLGSALVDAERKDAATAKFNQAIGNLLMAAKLNQDNSDAYQNLGICYRETGQKQKALEAFEKAEKLRGR